MARRASPVRTCVGCRQRAPASELLRFVAVEREGDTIVLEPDPARRRPGRGAHLHPDLACIVLAERRRAFGRALRVAGVIDAGPLVEHVEALGTAVGGATAPHPGSKVGRPT